MKIAEMTVALFSWDVTVNRDSFFLTNKYPANVWKQRYEWQTTRPVQDRDWSSLCAPGHSAPILVKRNLHPPHPLYHPLGSQTPLRITVGLGQICCRERKLCLLRLLQLTCRYPMLLDLCIVAASRSQSWRWNQLRCHHSTIFHVLLQTRL